MKKPNTPPEKIFRVDKKLVFKGTLPWAIVISVGLFLLMDNLKVAVTLKRGEFWVILGIIWAAKLLLMDLWSILYERIEFRGNIITSYLNGSNSADVLDFASVKQKKTIYTNYLGFEYKEPKGIIVRYLLPYSAYSSDDLQMIMREILRVNPNIKLEDELSKQIIAGTYKSKILG